MTLLCVLGRREWAAKKAEEEEASFKYRERKIDMDTEEEEERKLYLELFGDHGKVFEDLAPPAAGDAEMLGDGPGEDAQPAVKEDEEELELASDSTSVPPPVPPADIQSLYRAHVLIMNDAKADGTPLSNCLALVHDAACALDDALPLRPFSDQEGCNALSLAVVGGAFTETLARHPPKAGANEEEEGGELHMAVGGMVSRVEELLQLYPEQVRRIDAPSHPLELFFLEFSTNSNAFLRHRKGGKSISLTLHAFPFPYTFALCSTGHSRAGPRSLQAHHGAAARLPSCAPPAGTSPPLHKGAGAASLLCDFRPRFCPLIFDGPEVELFIVLMVACGGSKRRSEGRRKI